MLVVLIYFTLNFVHIFFLNIATERILIKTYFLGIEALEQLLYITYF